MMLGQCTRVVRYILTVTLRYETLRYATLRYDTLRYATLRYQSYRSDHRSRIVATPLRIVGALLRIVGTSCRIVVAKGYVS